MYRGSKLSTSEKQITNFEKWKQKLRLEDLIKNNNEIGINCSLCPAGRGCLGDNCRMHFVKWAKAPYIPWM